MNAVLSHAVQTVSQAATIQPWKIDTTRGSHNGVLNSQWSRRADDERFLSLDALDAFCTRLADESFAITADVRDVRVNASPQDPMRLTLDVDGHEDVKMTAHTFNQVCALTGTPASYMRKLPAYLAGINLQHGITSYDAELVKPYIHCTDDGHKTLRAVTSPSYGRILDRDLVRAVKRVTAGTDWKVPGCINWGNMTYDPHTPVTTQSTTLYASDRDVFIFLVDDLHPIEIGKLANGDPDMVFRMFYAGNSEVGESTLFGGSGYLRGICQNRNLWGVEGFKEFRIKHTSGAPQRFAIEAARKMREMVQAEPLRVVEGVKAAKSAIVASNDEVATVFLKQRKFSDKQARTILDTVMSEEGHPARSVWDIVQGITAVARTIPNANDRMDMEKRAGALLDAVKV